MKIPKEDVGKTVTIELARPIYIMDYAAHVTYPDGQKGLIGEPLKASAAKDAPPIAMPLLIGVQVAEVGEDSVMVSMLTPGGNQSLIRVPDALIAAVTEITAHQPDQVPTVTRLQQAPAASKLIL